MAGKDATVTGGGPPSRFQLVAAVVVLLAFAVFVVFLLVELNSSEVRWSRLAWVFASVEAIAFGAAGALFGSSIQRSRAENAEADARANSADAANGRALAVSVANDAPKAQGAAGFEAYGPGEQATAAAAIAQRHAELAKSLFPDIARAGE